MRSFFLDEPEMEFGGGGRHIDIRFGLTHFGPLDAGQDCAPRRVRLGLIGDAESIAQFLGWAEKCRHGITAKPTKLDTLFPAFPGFGSGCQLPDFTFSPTLIAEIRQTELDALASIDDRDAAMRESVDRYADEVRRLSEKGNVDAIVCLHSPVLLKRIDMIGPPRCGPRTRQRRTQAESQEALVWHDLLKARCMGFARPLQVSRPGTFGGAVQRFGQDGQPTKLIQDEATRAWNFFCALYYKAGGTPWRLLRTASDYATCYVGIAFYKPAGGDSLQTSLAQVFNERGEGVIVRGGPARISKDDRTPHLSVTDSERLLAEALATYRSEHKTMPARLVCHKTSYFDAEETAGCVSAAKTLNIDGIELLSMRKSRTRFFRRGSYPPLRGTCVQLEERQVLLYTNGSVDFYRCYPGPYVPRPLMIERHRFEQSAEGMAAETLALTKMNWNSTQFVNSLPITLAAADSVGSILRYLETDAPIQARYSYYM